MANETRYFPRSAGVKAAKLTADISGFILAFNNGRTSYPFAMSNGQAVFIVTGAGKATEVHVGDWIVESASGIEVCGSEKFCSEFCAAS
jgi:hypothetical protein